MKKRPDTFGWRAYGVIEDGFVVGFFPTKESALFFCKGYDDGTGVMEIREAEIIVHMHDDCAFCGEVHDGDHP